MKKVAKLVAVSIMTRVIVDEGATDEEIMKIARPRLIQNLEEDGICDHIESIEDDEEMPFGEGADDKLEAENLDVDNDKAFKRSLD